MIGVSCRGCRSGRLRRQRPRAVFGGRATLERGGEAVQPSSINPPETAAGVAPLVGTSRTRRATSSGRPSCSDSGACIHRRASFESFLRRDASPFAEAGLAHADRRVISPQVTVTTLPAQAIAMEAEGSGGTGRRGIGLHSGWGVQIGLSVD